MVLLMEEIRLTTWDVLKPWKNYGIFTIPTGAGFLSSPVVSVLVQIGLNWEPPISGAVGQVERWVGHPKNGNLFSG